MARIVVLFDLKDGVAAADYEAWARATDIPTVNGLESVAAFTVHRAASLLAGEGTPPYQYVEVIDVDDMGRFGAEIGSDTMQRVAAEFQAFADNPIFILTEDV